MRYDVVVIGNDEAAIEMASTASAAGQRTLSVLPEQRHSAWLIGQSLERLNGELLSDRSRQRQRQLIRAATPRLLQRLLRRAVVEELREQAVFLDRAGVQVVTGECRLVDRSRVQVSSGVEFRRGDVTGTNIVIATGVRQTAVHRPLGLLPFYGPESLFFGFIMPRSLLILGGDDVGAGLATLFSVFGTSTRLLTRVDGCSSALEFAHAAGVRIGTRPSELGLMPDTADWCRTEPVVDCRQAVGFSEHLGLPSIGVEPDEHGRLWCGTHLETWCEGVFGVGAIVGFGSERQQSPAQQAQRVLNRIQHRLRAPHFLSLNRERAGRSRAQALHET